MICDYLYSGRSTDIHQKEKEDLEEISSELELADEDDKVPYVILQIVDSLRYANPCRYKIGDSFVSLPVSEVQELLKAAVESIDKDVSRLEDKLGEYREEMQTLKSSLYARFGKSINLEV